MIDLHVHSTMSDGTYTPSQLIKLAKDKGLKAIALTDHDTIYGNKEAREAAKKYDMEFIHGMELSLNYNNHQIHVVALGFDEESKAFKDFYHELRQKKQSSIVSVIDYLQKQGLDISVEKVEPFIAGGALDKYAILRYLVSDKSKAGDIQYLWDRYIDPAFNNLNLKITENPKAEDAIQAMKKADTYSLRAHQRYLRVLSWADGRHSVRCLFVCPATHPLTYFPHLPIPAKPTKLQTIPIIIQTAEHSNISMSFCYTKSNILKNIRDLTTRNPTLSPSKRCLLE